MRTLAVVTVAVLLAACRGEKVPRDYQNNPPAMMHPVTSSQQTPTAHGMPGPSPEPSKSGGGENLTGKPTSATAPTSTMKDQAPVTPAPTTSTRL
jgi:hypothetical protein